MRILRSKNYRRMRWKNGGGETTEIIVAPEGAALDAFDWRVSMAHVASDGPFSLFPDIDRTLAVLDGNGIRLRVAGTGTFDLTPASEPLAFPADAAAGAELIDGPIHDLNVMSRRGVVRHRLTCVDVDESHTLQATNGATLLLIPTGGMTIATATSQASLDDGDSVLLMEKDGEAVLTPEARLTLYKCAFWRI